MLTQIGPSGPTPVATGDLFAGRVVLFAVPGAFTPTCSNQHLPGYIKNADAIKAKGVDKILCVSVNDAFVMQAWGEQQRAGDKVIMVADGNGDLAKALGLTMDGSKFGMGLRSSRYSMLIEDGVVRRLNIEPGKGAEVSGAENMLKQL
jgi:peroxiredoxin